MAVTQLPGDRRGLLRIAACDDPDRILDLVLVHGFGGDAFTTWMADPDRIETFWPNWLAEDRPRVGLWTLGYAADATKWKAESMALADRGTQVLDLLENEGLGDRPLVFVTHSLGGIVAKQLLRHADTFGVPRWRRIADQTCGIAFIATPHTGANLANFAQLASVVFRTNEQVAELTAHDSRLRELHHWFRGFYTDHGLVCRTWCERREVRPEIPLLGIRLPKGIVVVDETSAEPNLPGEVAVPLDEDHISICKPPSRTAQIYKSLLRWLDACAREPAPPSRARVAAAPPAPTTDRPEDPSAGTAGPPAAERTLVYISYSHKDREWHGRLRRVLDADPILRDLVWDDTRIRAGEDWEREIRGHVARARVMIILGSPDYFSPDSGARELETEPALAAHAKGELDILWFRVRRHPIETTPVGHIMAATGPGAVPLDAVPPEVQDAALNNIRYQVLDLLGRGVKPMKTAAKRFHIALSFPGEQRPFVKQVAEHLAERIGRERVLYDAYYEAELARPDLDTYLQRLYHDESELIAVFLCADYERKDWCGLEWRVVRDLIKRRRSSDIMPLRFDATEIPGLFSIDGYAWIGDGRSAESVADLILQRWEIEAGRTSEQPAPATPAPAAVKAAGPAAAPRVSPALAIWQEKLDYFLEQEAAEADHARKFQLRKQIEECRTKIRELGGTA